MRQTGHDWWLDSLLAADGDDIIRKWQSKGSERMQMGNVLSLSSPRMTYLKITHLVGHVEIGWREMIEDQNEP
jgi:hypothetical protein